MEGYGDMNEKLEQLKQYLLAQGSLAVGLACMPWQRAPIRMTACPDRNQAGRV